MGWFHSALRNQRRRSNAFFTKLIANRVQGRVKILSLPIPLIPVEKKELFLSLRGTEAGQRNP